MAGDIENPRIWAEADVLVAPVGTTTPTDIESAFDAEFDYVGLIGEDGLEMANDSDSTEHYAYGGKLIRVTRSKHKKTFKFMILEDNAIAFGLVNPGSTVETAAGITTRTVKIPTSNPMCFAVERMDGDVTSRLVIPRGEVTEVGSQATKDNEIAGVELTVECYADDEGVFYIEITDDPQAAVA